MKVKRIISALLSAAMLSLPAVPVMADEKPISVLVDNENVQFDQAPIIEEGRTLVPIRAVFEKAGAEVKWDQDTQTATIAKGEYNITITLNDNYLYKNGEAVELDVPAKLVNDRILIPVRAIGEAMDFAITWDGFNFVVVVSTDGKPMRPYVAKRMVYRPLLDAAEYYKESSFAWENIDVDGDGSMDTVSFTASAYNESEKKPLLIINGENLSDELEFMHNTFSFAVVDIDKSDNHKEIMISSIEDVRTAYFFRFENNKLIPITAKNGNASIDYLYNVFFDEKSFMISDLEGITWTDIMITGSAYYLEGTTLKNALVENAEHMLPRVLVNTYPEDILYKVYDTDSFNGGSYKTAQPDRIIHSSELERFTVQQMYIDEYSPSYVEFFITLPDGPNMVISPYTP